MCPIERIHDPDSTVSSAYSSYLLESYTRKSRRTEEAKITVMRASLIYKVYFT